ncbi:MAG: nitroreductase/quinone reductase family protein [Pseudonocardiales bacterium]
MTRSSLIAAQPGQRHRRSLLPHRQWQRLGEFIVVVFGRPDVVNPIVKAAVALRLAPPSYAIIETIGRKSGLPRRTPVGNGVDGDTFWLGTELLTVRIDLDP